jgi:hypothetical protein
MMRKTYDEACHIIRNLACNIEKIHKPCKSCSFDVVLKCAVALTEAEGALKMLKKNELELH